jgi:molybdopterin converting factor small subunit
MLGDVPDEARLRISRPWLNGEMLYADVRRTPCGPDDEIAVLPPISGG